MDRFTLSMEEYSKALSEAEAGYLQHLVNDFTLTPDGKVIAKLSSHVDQQGRYIIRDRSALFSSL